MMNERCIRVGLIGYGRSGRDIHAWTIGRTGGRFKIAAISDVTERRRTQAAAEHSCPIYSDYREMAARGGVDLYVNTAFTNLHVPISIELMNQNAAVLCEKPLTDSLSEFEELAETARRTGSFFTVFHNLRYEPVYVKLREWLASGLIGEPLQIAMHAGQFTRRWDWQMSRAHGGGLLMVSGVHILDLALRLAGVGYEPEITACLKHYGVGDADNYAKLLLTSEDGPAIDIECSYYDAFPRPRYHVQGVYGTIRCDETSIEAIYYDPSEAPPVILDTVPIESPGGSPAFCRDELPMKIKTWRHRENLYHASFLAYYDHLYRALAGQAEPPVTLEELRQQARVLDACYKNAKL